jgi:hypothetical protein
MRTVQEMIIQRPKLAAVMDEQWLRQQRYWFETSTMMHHVWYQQVEHDLTDPRMKS